MSSSFCVLIVGGYGTFGGRLVQLLEAQAGLTLLVAGRSLAAAQAYCARRVPVSALLVPIKFDRIADDPGQLGPWHADLVVDASGPFQAYGDDRYRLIERCIGAGIPYLDLADGSEFVEGVAQFDEAARAAGLYVLSGVSSYPVLTAAVVRRLLDGIDRLHTVHGGIAPSPYAGVGLNVIRAIAGYAGQRIAMRRGGDGAVGYPFTESKPFTIAVPGRLPLSRRRFSLVDVPDLRTLPKAWPQVRDVWMGAAPVPAVLHRALIACAWLVRLRMLPGLSWLATTMHAATNHVRWGEHRGGMFVRIHGQGLDGKSVERQWHLLAEGDDGPLIPSMGAAAIIRNVLAGRAPSPGARAAVADVELSDYEALFSVRTIHTGLRSGKALSAAPLFQRLLGSSWEALPAPIQTLHSTRARSYFDGVCTVVRGRNPLGRLIAEFNGFPRAGIDLPLSVEMQVEGDGERWTRRSGERSFSSTQRAGSGATQWLLGERFGPVAVFMALVVDGPCLRYVMRRWSVFGVTLPLWLGPRAVATESIEQGLFCFDVQISHPLAGLIVHYRGTLQPRLVAT